MILEELVFGVAFAVLLVTWILFVIFSRITVRKLRKNPETKHELGIEFVSGLDTLNVAQALSVPRAIIRKFKTTKMSFFYADPDLLYKHTNWFDRFFARLFFWPFVLSGVTLILLMILDLFGFST